MSLRFGHLANNAGRAACQVGVAVFAIGGLASAGIAPTPAAAQSAGAPRATAVRLGIDVWLATDLAPLAGKRIGLITNITGRTADRRSSVDVLAADPRVELAALFTPEHSFFADREGDIDDDRHAGTGLPLHSLYGETRRPTAAMLAGLDGLVFDIQDIGTRIYTYATTLAFAMEEAAAHGLPIVVLDRPNPIGGRQVSGPVLDEDRISFVGYAPIPVRHGMTIGELARYFNGERGIGAALTVIPVEGWSRSMWFDDTGLEWINPSPNIRNPVQALLYPALGPLEWTDISVGRGTDEPFEWFGAPWMDGQRVAEALRRARVPGVTAVPKRITPDASVHAGESCDGVHLTVTDRDALDTGLLLATIATTLADVHGSEWERDRLVGLWGDAAIEAQLEEGLSAREIASAWAEELAAFERVRARYLIYD